MTLMTKEVWEILQKAPPLRGFAFQPVEYDNWIALRIFKDNFTSFTQQEQRVIGRWITQDLIVQIRKLGIPCYIEVWDTHGGREI